MIEVIYLAPLCQEHERMWCEHDAPIDCECIDGPHPWIKYVAALRQPIQSDALTIAASALLADVRRRHPNEDLRCEYMIALDAALQEQSK